MSLIAKVKKHGILGSARKALSLVDRKTKTAYNRWLVRNAPEYVDPTPSELVKIEKDLHALGVVIHDYVPSLDGFKDFQAEHYFPLDYHGGINGSVWNEKILEHWIAAECLELMNYKPDEVYIDVAAGTSPWAKILRDRIGISAYAIDLGEVALEYKDLPFYRIENATSTSFSNASVKGASLQCAFEMFMGNDDTGLLKEMARILVPGGKLVIVPLYTHTHYCSYSTPEYYGKEKSDLTAKEYVCLE